MRVLFLALGFLLLAGGAAAQSVAIDLGANGQPGATARLVQLTALIGLLSLAPSLLVMATAFTRIVIVLALLRSAIGAQGVPPNPVLIGLALFLTFFVMQPVLEAAWTQGILPMTEGRMDEMAGLTAAAQPFTGSCRPMCAPPTLRCSSTSRTCPPPRRRRRPGAR